jgi:hypothetical protein
MGDMNRDPAEQSLNDMTWKKALSTSTQEDQVRGLEPGKPEGGTGGAKADATPPRPEKRKPAAETGEWQGGEADPPRRGSASSASDASMNEGSHASGGFGSGGSISSGGES